MLVGSIRLVLSIVLLFVAEKPVCGNLAVSMCFLSLWFSGAHPRGVCLPHVVGVLWNSCNRTQYIHHQLLALLCICIERAHNRALVHNLSSEITTLKAALLEF